MATKVNKKGPCYQCQKRKVGCHARCPDYTEWRDAMTKRNDEIRSEKIARANRRPYKDKYRKKVEV